MTKQYNLHSESLEVVLLGSFNPAILHPQWFVRHGLTHDSDAGQANIQVINNGLASFDLFGMKILCVPQKLSITTHDLTKFEPIKDYSYGILKLLNHTPVQACGINSVVNYEILSDAYWHKIGHTLAPKEIWNAFLDNPGMESLAIKAKSSGPFSSEKNITVMPSREVHPGLRVAANTHFPLKDAKEINCFKQIEEFFGEEWEDAKILAKSTASKIFESITPDH